MAEHGHDETIEYDHRALLKITPSFVDYSIN